MATPLAERMRPTDLDNYVGQEHLVKQGAVLRKAIEGDQIHSFILWGPPGVGKTTLARIIAHQLHRPFRALSAVNAGVKDVRNAIEQSRKQQFFDRGGPILFIDEIHRFSKSQQDSLLGAVEEGTIVLIGATTENPSFEVISALLSRCQIYILKPLEKVHLEILLNRAITLDSELKNKQIKILESEALIHYSGGDARKLYNALEIVVASLPEGQIGITNAMVENTIQQNLLLYDKGGDQHYDIISAFIKSIRGSDPNAALYWLARMIEAGEDAKFICRRLMISAAEDIGLANPNALLMATQCFHAVQAVGFPEARIILSQAVIYLAVSEKSNSAYTAIAKAQEKVKEVGNLPVPLHLRNAPTDLMKQLNYGKEYQYAHDFPGNFVHQTYLPPEIQDQIFYEPGGNSVESRIAERLRKWWAAKYKV